MTRMRGFTLVEVLVAMSVGTFVLGIAYTLMLMSGVQAKETELDVTMRQDIRFLQEMLIYDLQYLDIADISEASGTTSLMLTDGSIVKYSFVQTSGTLSRTGTDGLVRTFLKGRIGSFVIEETEASPPMGLKVEFTADGKPYEFDITNRLRSGKRSFGYQIPPSIIASPNYLLYVDLENGKLVRLKDEGGAVIAEPEVLDYVPDRIEIVQSSSKAPVQVNLYQGTLLLYSYGYNESLSQFNGKGSADTVPMMYFEGMTRDTSLDLKIENKRNLSGANASFSFQYRYLDESAALTNELKFNDSYFDIY